MEYSEIIKALEDWIKNYDGSYVNFKILGNALDLITRQQAELENLKVENQSLRSAANSLKMHYEEAQAEIERLENHLAMAKKEIKKCVTHYKMACSERNDFLKQLKTAKSEAVKGFAEKVKEFMHNKFKALDEYEFEYITERDIDNLSKETEGENNA